MTSSAGYVSCAVLITSKLCNNATSVILRTNSPRDYYNEHDIGLLDFLGFSRPCPNDLPYHLLALQLDSEATGTKRGRVNTRPGLQRSRWTSPTFSG